MLRQVAPVVLATLALGCPARHSAGPAAPEPAAPPAAAGGGDERPHFDDFSIEDNHLVLPSPIVFSGDSLDVEANTNALWYIHDFLAAKDYVTLARIEGHGTEPGEDALNYTGGEALAVGGWLVEHGVDCKRLLVAAFGDTKPVADSSTAEGRAKNHRIEIVTAELRGRAIGGMPVDGGAPKAAPVCD